MPAPSVREGQALVEAQLQQTSRRGLGRGALALEPRKKVVMFHVAPSHQEHVFAYPHMTVSTGPDSHENRCEEGLKLVSCKL